MEKTFNNFKSCLVKRTLLASLLLFLGGCAAQEPDQKPYYQYANVPHTQGFPVLVDMAEGGSADAQFLVGKMYDDGEGTPKDPAKALAWYQKASLQYQPCAMTRFAFELTTGANLPQNVTRAFILLQRAAESGHPLALVSLGEMHYFGQGTDQDVNKALVLYQKSLEKGCAEAIFATGRYYLERSQDPRDQVEGFKGLHIYYLWQSDKFTESNPSPEKATMMAFYDAVKSQLPPQIIEAGVQQAAEWYLLNKPTLLKPMSLLKSCMVDPEWD